MMKLARVSVVFYLLCMSFLVHAEPAKRLSMPIEVNGISIPYYDFALYLMPKEKLKVSVKGKEADITLTFLGETREIGKKALFVPTKAGRYLLEVNNKTTKEKALISIFVMVPANKVDKSGKLNGYQIGAYPSSPLRGLSIYLPPKGFVEVTKKNKDTLASPHFTLGQFVAKQPTGYPKYVVLRPEMLLKLERILTALNQAGHPTKSMVVMSGYRTPWYNRRIGNVQYSRHVWGGAADIYIDENPKDGVMDDLNKDGKIDRNDAEWLVNFIASMPNKAGVHSHIGGLGVYGSNAAHGPFVHVDVRGSHARW
jgi:hypothetical protein